ncbi:MAG: universal stress protein [Candidatus Nitrosotenuis sp.]|nr:universal stress protein [Candidatus Nitrosotenuis sp.]
MGKKYQSILVPYDGSSYSKKSLSEAIEIAKKFDSDLYLLAVVDPTTVAPLSFYLKPGSAVGISRFGEYLNSAISKTDLLLRDQVIKCKDNDVTADYEVLAGSPASVILQFAKKRKINLIVMGSQGLSGIKRIRAIGSISRKVSEQAACPVLLVR